MTSDGRTPPIVEQEYIGGDTLAKAERNKAIADKIDAALSTAPERRDEK